VPLRPNTSGCASEKGSGYRLPHWKASKGQASSGSGPQSDLETNEIEVNWTGNQCYEIKSLVNSTTFCLLDEILPLINTLYSNWNTGIAFFGPTFLHFFGRRGPPPFFGIEEGRLSLRPVGPPSGPVLGSFFPFFLSFFLGWRIPNLFTGVSFREGEGGSNLS